VVDIPVLVERDEDVLRGQIWERRRAGPRARAWALCARGGGACGENGARAGQGRL